MFEESVRADEIFCVMVVGESVMRIRERAEGADLDIFWEGLARDMMRFVGAEVCQLSWRWTWWLQSTLLVVMGKGDLQRMV